MRERQLSTTHCYLQTQAVTSGHDRWLHLSATHCPVYPAGLGSATSFSTSLILTASDARWLAEQLRELADQIEPPPAALADDGGIDFIESVRNILRVPQ